MIISFGQIGQIMRIAVIADFHGDIRALEAVRADLARRSPDVVVNLGDHLSGPLQAPPQPTCWSMTWS